MIKPCEVCGSEKNVIKHHLSYKLEKTILVCRSCHSRIHLGDLRPDLKPIDSSGFTMIQISKEIYDWLLSLKIIPEEPFNAVLLRIKSGDIKKW